MLDVHILTSCSSNSFASCVKLGLRSELDNVNTEVCSIISSCDIPGMICEQLSSLSKLVSTLPEVKSTFAITLSNSLLV